MFSIASPIINGRHRRTVQEISCRSGLNFSFSVMVPHHQFPGSFGVEGTELAFVRVPADVRFEKYRTGPARQM
jgi:hypothetical protein